MQYGCNKSQKLFIEQAIKADIRLDGRKNTQLRRLNIQKGILNQAQGSALLTLPFQHFSVYASIKLQLVQRASREEQPSITLSVQSVKRRHNDDFKDAKDEKTLKILEQLLAESLVRNVRHDVFFIKNSEKHILKFFIDVFLLNYVHSCNLDLIYQTVISAFEDLKIPTFKVIINEMTGQEDVQLNEQTTLFPYIHDLPALYQIGELQNQLVCDLTEEQYDCMDNIFIIALKKEDIVVLRQLKGEMAPEALLKVLNFAKKIQMTKNVVN